MGWTAPTTRSTGDLITASIWNVDLKDNLIFLKTKELWSPVTFGTNGITADGRWPVASLNAANDAARMSFAVPDDFLTLTEAIILVKPQVTDAAANWNIISDYGAPGEDYQNHTETDAATTYNVTLDQLFEVDASGILTGIAVGDYVGIVLVLDDAADDVSVIGFRMKYA